MPKYTFIPRLPTKEAYDNKAFQDQYNQQMFYDALIAKDLGDNMRGFIYFKEGIKSEYRDGTEGHTYETRKWWELGYTCCANECCFVPPNEDLMGWKTDDGSEALTSIIEQHKKTCAENYEKHLEDPRPMPKFKKAPLPITREWQEFKRIRGPGGFIEQYEMIKDKSTIRTIMFSKYGYFRVE